MGGGRGRTGAAAIAKLSCMLASWLANELIELREPRVNEMQSAWHLCLLAVHPRPRPSYIGGPKAESSGTVVPPPENSDQTFCTLT